MSNVNLQVDWFSKPGDTLSTLMIKRQLSPAALAQNIGADQSLIYDLLSGAASIDQNTAVLLSKNVGGSPSFWAKRQAQFDRSLDQAARAVPPTKAKSWLKALPLKDMARAGWITRSDEEISDIRSSLLFFGVVDPEEWHYRYAEFANSFSFRTSPTFRSKVGALAAWLRQGEILAKRIGCSTWNARRFIAQLPLIRTLTKTKSPAYFIPRLRALCADAGVAVVFVQAPSGCRASGATRFLSSKQAMIIMSFRHLSDDHFWFTFFHEAGHLLLHKGELTFIDGGITAQSDKEAEANRFSAGTLIPHERSEELAALRPRSRDVIRFALSIGTSPGIVVGQMQHRRIIAPSQLNHLKRRFDWAELGPLAD